MVKIVLTDLDSIAMVEGTKNQSKQLVLRDGTIQSNACIINQNYIERYARDLLASDVANEEQSGYINALFEAISKNYSIAREGFGDSIKLELKSNGGSLSTAIKNVVEKSTGISPDSVDSIWCDWANAATSIFMQQHQELLGNKDNMLVLAPKVSSNPKTLEKLFNALGQNKGEVLYYQTKTAEPQVFLSDNFTNHLNKAVKIAAECGAEISSSASAGEKSAVLKAEFAKGGEFSKKFTEYVSEVVKIRQSGALKACNSLGAKIIGDHVFANLSQQKTAQHLLGN